MELINQVGHRGELWSNFVDDHGSISSPSVFNDDDEMAFDTQQTTVVSNFDEGNILTLGKSPTWQKTGLRHFASLVSNRFSYLGGLQNLEPDWVSGGAVKPSSSAIFLSKALLASIRKKVISEEVSIIPRIVMGPVPSGGIIVELHADEDNAINVTITNEDHVELEVLYDGCYFDVNISGSELIGMVTAQYASISR